MESLDVEQQLRMAENERKKQLSSDLSSSVSFLHASYFDASYHIVLLFVGLCICTAFGFLVAMIIVHSNTKSNSKYAADVLRKLRLANAAFVSRVCSPWSYTAMMALWVVLVGVATGCSVLRDVAHHQYHVYMENEHLTASAQAKAPITMTLLHLQPVILQPPIHPSLAEQLPLWAQWLLTPTALLFAVQFDGILLMWLHTLFIGGPNEVALIGALLTFFPAFYSALLLNGKEPDRWPVWLTLFNFLCSLFSVWSTGQPLVLREYRAAMGEIQKHTQQALFKDRKELQDIRKSQRAKSKMQ